MLSDFDVFEGRLSRTSLRRKVYGKASPVSWFVNNCLDSFHDIYVGFVYSALTWRTHSSNTFCKRALHGLGILSGKVGRRCQGHLVATLGDEPGKGKQISCGDPLILWTPLRCSLTADRM